MTVEVPRNSEILHVHGLCWFASAIPPSTTRMRLGEAELLWDSHKRQDKRACTTKHSSTVVLTETLLGLFVSEGS